LLAGGADVVVVDNISSGNEANLNPRAKLYNLNIADPQFEDILEKERPGVIYHFAFYVFVPKSAEDPLLDMDVLVGSIRLLKKARELGVEKIFFASSGFLYGNSQHLPAKESRPVDPVSPYVVSKRAIENYLQFYKNAFGVPYVILRYAAVYGPRQVTGAMADYIRRLARGEQAEMWGDGNKTRDYVFIEDVVKANLLALGAPDDIPNPVFNVGTGKETTLNTLYGKIAGILGKEAKPTYYTDRAGEQLRYCLDNSRAKEVLGWKPTYSLDEGLKSTIDFARSKGFKI
jgi:UDP-glucose 4-epimerase